MMRWMRLAVGIMRKKVNWVLDADIRGFFDTIDHGWLMKFIEHRIADRRVLRLIQKWLKAGVMRTGQTHDDGSRHPARGNGIAVAGQHLSALCAGSVGAAVETAACAR